jgi:hypothetical protein
MDNKKTPDEFAQAMLERIQDPSKVTKARPDKFGDQPHNIFSFSKIEDRDGAIKVVTASASVFIVVAAIQAVVAFFIGYAGLVDAFIYAVLGAILMRFKSRVVAVILFFLAIVATVVTVANAIGAKLGGGTNIFLSLMILWAGVRAVEATFKLHGRFSAATVKSESSASSSLPPTFGSKRSLGKLVGWAIIWTAVF